MSNNAAINQHEGWRLEHTYACLPDVFYRHQEPTMAPLPQMVIFNDGLALDLGLDPEALKSRPEIFAGSRLPHQAQPIAQAYAGYQFGHFAMLGDGRAVLLGEQITPAGLRYDIQLKGSGPTPFSRGGDGYAALLPMLREYIISEAMFYLGIPTTRSLAVALTGRDVYREKVLPGAVLTRVAASHIRVGTFNYISAYSPGDLLVLADYAISRHFPGLLKDGSAEENIYISFLREVASRQAALIARWQLVGFVHGVMNTDNMAISGETIDYGPCAFMDVYHPDTVFSSIDVAGRYSYKNQPIMGAWNLSRFAESLLPLIDEDKDKAIAIAQGEIEYYWEMYNENWLTGMCAKLGIVNEEAGNDKSEDAALIAELLDIMEEHKLDYTGTFRQLTHFARYLQGQDDIFAQRPFDVYEQEPSGISIQALLDIPDFSKWHKKWQDRLSRQSQGQNPYSIMKAHNPAIIPRNHRVEEALSAAEHGDYSVMHNLLAALSRPYEESEGYSHPPKIAACGYKTFCGT